MSRERALRFGHVHARAFVTTVTALVVAAACTSREPAPTSHVHEGDEHLGRTSQELSSSPQFGTSLPAKTLSLTFDDGPGTRTSALSTYLKNQDIKATFFVNGQRMMPTQAPLPAGSYTPIGEAAYETLLAQLVADGHLVANHTTTHRNVTSLSATQIVAELKQTDDLIAPYVPANRFLFRAPFGSWNTTAWNNLKNTAMNKYVGHIGWEAGGFSDQFPNRAADWWCWQNGKTSAQCGDAYVKEIDTYFPKGIVLMHDPYPDPGDAAPGTTLDMVKYMVPILKTKGYSFVRLDEVPAIAALLPCDANCATCNGPNPDQCLTCSGGKFLEAGTCKACSACAPGTFTSAACTTTADTACSACDATCATCTGADAASCTSCSAGTRLNGSTCQACSACAAGTYASAACTTTTDTVCSACDVTCATCTGPSAAECGTCAPGKFLSNGTCTTCTACGAGTFASAACTASANTVCAPCEAGTWSAGNASSCAACGSCDDGDACTTEACAPSKGCIHMPIAGCTPPTPDAGTSGSSSGGTSSGMPVGIDAGSVIIEDGIEVTDGKDGKDSGCATSPAPRSSSRGSASLVLGLLASAAFARRRRARPTPAQ